MVDRPVALVGAVLALVYGFIQCRQAREPLVEARYPFVRTMSRPLRVAAAVWIWIVAVLMLLVAL